MFALLVPAPTSGPRLDQRHAQVEARELAGDRRADHAGADDRDVPVRHAVHADPYSASRDRSHGTRSHSRRAGPGFNRLRR